MRHSLGVFLAALSALCAPAVAQVIPLEIRSLTPPNGSGYSALFRLTVADGGGATWRRTAARAGAPLENAHCRIVPSESRIAANGSPVSIDFAVHFPRGFEGTKLVYAYANAFGDTRNTGWQEAGPWRLLDEGVRPSAAALAAAAAGTPDPNDLPILELNRPDTPFAAYLRANPSATPLTHQQGALLFQPAAGKRASVFGPVTHRDLTSGSTAPATPFSSGSSASRSTSSRRSSPTTPPGTIPCSC